MERINRVIINKEDVSKLPFGTKIAIIIKRTESIGYETYFGVKFGLKIGYSDGCSQYIEEILAHDINYIYLM